MVFIKGGTFVMGGNNAQARPDEFPQHKDTANDIWVDKTEVTNAQFKKFIEATGYITTAERSFEVEGQSYPPGALVFDPNQPDFWWKFVEGASWKHPYGPNSNIEGKDDHPVVQVSWYDAQMPIVIGQAKDYQQKLNSSTFHVVKKLKKAIHGETISL